MLPQSALLKMYNILIYWERGYLGQGGDVSSQDLGWELWWAVDGPNPDLLV